MNFKYPPFIIYFLKQTLFKKKYPTPIANYFQSRITCSDWLGLFFPITSSISYCPALGAHRHKHTHTHTYTNKQEGASRLISNHLSNFPSRIFSPPPLSFTFSQYSAAQYSLADFFQSLSLLLTHSFKQCPTYSVCVCDVSNDAARPPIFPISCPVPLH